MKRLLIALTLLTGMFTASTSAFAEGRGHHGGHGGYYNGGHHHGGGSGIGIWIGPGFPFPVPYPYPYPNPYPPRPYPGNQYITVLVSDSCGTYYVTAYWDNYYGGYWYRDCYGQYIRVR